MTTFKDIITDHQLLQAVEALGFTEPTEIQAATIPPGLQGKDIIGQAKTGSGKTFSFGIPILHTITEEEIPQALILAPTRELCQQIASELERLTKHKRARIAAVYGGVGINPQIEDLERAQIVVGTPGRVLDHLERGTFYTEKVKVLVLDEADRMFDMGFIDDMEAIIKQLPEKRQTLLFSATMPEEIKSLANRYLYNPEHIKTMSHVEEHYLPQFYYVVERMRKFSLLAHLLQHEKPKLAIIFCATRTIADVVARNLQRHRINAEAIHGGLSQAKRTQIMEQFRNNKLHVLVATDVAARGLDVKNVTHVINYDVPKNPEDYVHRIGRTARAGESGKAITILEERDFEFFQAVLGMPNVDPKELPLPDFKSVGFRKNDGPREGGFGGGNGGGGFRGERRGDNRREGAPRREYGGGRPQGGRRENTGGGYGHRSSGAGHGQRSSSDRSESSSGKSESSSHGGGWKQSRRRG